MIFDYSKFTVVIVCPQCNWRTITLRPNTSRTRERLALFELAARHERAVHPGEGTISSRIRACRRREIVQRNGEYV